MKFTIFLKNGYLQCEYNEVSKELHCTASTLIHLEDGVYLVSPELIGDKYTVTDIESADTAKLLAADMCRKAKMYSDMYMRDTLAYTFPARLGKYKKGDMRPTVKVSPDTIKIGSRKEIPIEQALSDGTLLKVSSDINCDLYYKNENGNIILVNNRLLDEFAIEPSTAIDKRTWQYAKYIYNKKLNVLVCRVYRLSRPGYYFCNLYKEFIRDHIETAQDAVDEVDDILSQTVQIGITADAVEAEINRSFFKLKKFDYRFTSRKGIEYIAEITQDEKEGSDTVEFKRTSTKFVTPYLKGIEAFHRLVEIKELKQDLEIESQRILSGRWKGVQ